MVQARYSTKSGYLVIQADDFGLSPQISEDILHVIDANSITSVSVMVITPCWKAIAPYVQEVVRRNLGVGLHVTLTDFPWCTQPNWHFTRRTLFSAYLAGKITPALLWQELTVQYHRLCTLGITPDHIDSHQHVHLFPPFFQVFTAFARQHNLWLRKAYAPFPPLPPVTPSHSHRTTSTFSFGLSAIAYVQRLLTGTLYWWYEAPPGKTRHSSRWVLTSVHDIGTVSPSTYLALLRYLRTSCQYVELMVHPFRKDPALPPHLKTRERFWQVCHAEWQVLRSLSLVACARTLGWQPITFRQIQTTFQSQTAP